MTDLPDAPLTAVDVQVFDDSISDAAAQAMIASVWADTLLVAPCLDDDEFAQDKPALAVKLQSIIRGVVLRWADAGSGGVRSRGALDYNEALETGAGGGKLRPNEIRDLQGLCSQSVKASQKAHTFPMFAWERPRPSVHPFITDTEHGAQF